MPNQDFQQTLTYSFKEITRAVALLESLLNRCTIFTFTGTLGAGKTTLIRAFLQTLGVTEHITSPTFSYVNIYTTANNRIIYHFDLYRMSSLEEFFAQGFEEYLQQPNSIVLIEWPELLEHILSNNMHTCHIQLDYNGLNKRRLKALCPNT